MLLAGCVDGTSNKTSSQQAQDYLDNVESQMREKYNDEYFKSAQWKAFVDNYWQSFNEAQKENDSYLISSSPMTE